MSTSKKQFSRKLMVALIQAGVSDDIICRATSANLYQIHQTRKELQGVSPL